MNQTIGDNLRTYRTLANLSLEKAGELLNISAPAVLKYERNETEGTLERLIEFSNIYNVTLDDILEIENNVEIKFENLNINKNTPVYKENIIRELIRKKVNNYFKMLKFSKLEYENKFGVHKVHYKDGARTLAYNFREFFNIPNDSPIFNLVYILEENDIMLITIPKDENTKDFKGFYELINNIPVIAILEEDTGYNQRYNLARNLGEMLIISDNKKELAKEFAKSLLSSKESIIKEFEEKRTYIDFKELEIYSNNYKVSYKLIVDRLEAYNVITKSNAKYLNIHINKNKVKELPHHEKPNKYEKIKSILKSKKIIS